jgi:hypothetical protein
MLPGGWSIEHDDECITVFSPGQKYGGSLGGALETGTICGEDSDITIPHAVMRVLLRHGRALECSTPVAVRDVAHGDYFIRSPLAAAVYIRGDYDKAARRFSCTEAEDMNREIFLDGDAKVLTGFSY